jgi:hypothetical protein
VRIEIEREREKNCKGREQEKEGRKEGERVGEKGFLMGNRSLECGGARVQFF